MVIRAYGEDSSKTLQNIGARVFFSFGLPSYGYMLMQRKSSYVIHVSGLRAEVEEL